MKLNRRNFARGAATVLGTFGLFPINKLFAESAPKTFKFKLGDRVKDIKSGKEGVVVNITCSHSVIGEYDEDANELAITPQTKQSNYTRVTIQRPTPCARYDSPEYTGYVEYAEDNMKAYNNLHRLQKV
jgi:hypothetical protein